MDIGEFTAINTSSQARHVCDASASTGNAYSPDMTLHDPTVSSYLGRGENVCHIPGLAFKTPKVRKIGIIKRKRVSEPGCASKTKHQKSNEICNSMNVGKSSPAATRPGNVKLQANVSKGTDTTWEQLPIDLIPQKTIDLASTKDTSPSTGTVAPISVWASSTSMTSLRSVGQITSLDSVKASAEYGIALYTRSSSPDLQQTGVEYSRPWLNTILAETSSKTRSSAELHDPARPVQFTIAGIYAETASPYPSPEHSSSRIARAVSSITSVDDTLIQSDDDFDDQAVRMADSLSSGIKSLPKEINRSAEDRQVVLHHPVPANRDSVINGSLAAVESKCKPNDEGIHDEHNQDDVEGDFITMFNDLAEFDIKRSRKDPPPRTATQNMREVDANDDYGGALLSEAEKEILNERALACLRGGPRPIARDPFPAPVQDRSPIFGASNLISLRTCFRIGEALNVGSHSVRLGKPVILELYARVIQSWREATPSRKQQFVFRDLYHDNPPQIRGTFELWDQSSSWDLDGRPFLNATDSGSMCRVMAKMKRDGRSWDLGAQHTGSELGRYQLRCWNLLWRNGA